MRARHIVRACALLATAHPALLLAAPGLRGEAAAVRAPQAAEHALEYVLGIVAVMIALGVFALLMRRMQARLGNGSSALRIAASLPLGGKERLVLVEAEGERLLLGVGPGGVHLVRKLREQGSRGAGADGAIAQHSWLARTLHGAAAR